MNSNEWSQEPPGESGIYLRVNIAHRVQKHTVSDGYIDWGFPGEQKVLPVTHEKLKGWWWLGPLPYPPTSSGIVHHLWPKEMRQG